MRTFQVVVLAVCAAAAMGSLIFSRDLDQEWEMWKTQNSKMYTAEEEVQRRLIWEENARLINKHNLDYDMGLTSFRMGMNKYGDLTTTEFVKKMNGFLPGHPDAENCPSTFTTPNFLVRPKSVDWRKKGYVTPVKNQMDCGSCWAFSTTGALEGQHFKKTGNLVSLSEQNLVDCSGDEGNLGCEGGWPVWADEYILKNGGIDTEASYPYVGVDEQCKFKKANIGATITGCTEVKAKSEEKLQDAIASIGPISVCIDAGHASFQMYSSGVYNEPDCSTTALDHCVLAVGYDVTSDGTEYYIVKNSWGTDWGMDGYIWMSRDQQNQCGIATNATYPLV